MLTEVIEVEGYEGVCLLNQFTTLNRKERVDLAPHHSFTREQGLQQI